MPEWYHLPLAQIREEINAFWKETEECSQAIRNLWVQASAGSDEQLEAAIMRLRRAFDDVPRNEDVYRPPQPQANGRPALKRGTGIVVPSKAARRHIVTSQRILREDGFMDDEDAEFFNGFLPKG